MILKIVVQKSIISMINNVINVHNIVINAITIMLFNQ